MLQPASCRPPATQRTSHRPAPSAAKLQKLLSALETANQVASLLSSGGSQQELERLCSSFVADTQASTECA